MKHYDRYQMNFDSRSMKASMASMGIGVFFLFVYFFGWRALWQTTAADWIFSFGLPVAVGVAYIILGRFHRRNAPGMFALLGAVLCLCLMISSLSSGSVVRIILSLVWYALCAWLLMLAAGGNLPGKLPVSMFFGTALTVRLVFFDLMNLRSVNWIREIAVIAMLLALTLLPVAFQSTKKAAA